MPLDSRACADTPVRVRIPQKKTGPLESYRKMQRKVLELIPAQAYHEPIISGGGLRRWHMISDPDMFERVLKTHEGIYRKSDLTRRVLGPTAGQNVVVAEGDAWKRQHRAMTPVFQRQKILNLAPSMSQSADRWSRRIPSGPSNVIDAHAEMTGLTSEIICTTALSGREELDRGHLVEEIGRYLSFKASVSILDLIGAPPWIPRPTHLFDRVGPRIDKIIDSIISSRIKRGPSETPDILDLLITAGSRGPGASLTTREIRNNLIVFIIAGHETTALALTWSLYLLAFDRDAQLRARALARDVIGDRTATAEDVPRLGYIRQIIEEAMRLYPPGAFMTRTARDHDELGGRRIRPGDSIILPIYALHRHHSLWDHPDHFNPDRFAPELSKQRHRYCYLPFSAGPRICIGMSFAMMEMVIILATYLARIDVGLVDGFEPEIDMQMTLRPAHGMKLRASRL